MSETDVLYENTADPEWTRRALDLLRQGDLQVKTFRTEGVASAQVWGPCPRCGHDLNVQQTLSAAVGDFGNIRGGVWDALVGLAQQFNGHQESDEAPLPDALDLGCGCEHTHSGAPRRVIGCGASFRLPTAPPDGGGALP